MPGFGSDYGNAYIEVHADTKALRAELKLAAAEAGKEFGHDWGEEADTSLGKEMTVLGRHIEVALKKSGRDGGVNFADALEDGVRQRLRNFDQDIVDSALSGDWSRAIEGRFDDLGAAVTGVKQRFAELAEQWDLSERAMQDLNGSFDSWTHSVKMDNAFQVLHEDALKLNADFDKTQKATRDAADEFDRLHDEAHRLNQVFEDSERAHQDFVLSMARVHASLIPVRQELVNLSTRDEKGILVRTEKDADDVADAFGRVRRGSQDVRQEFSVLGRLAGSRNNFFNLVGRGALLVETGAQKIVSGLENIGSTFLKFVGQAVEGNEEIEGTTNNIQKAIGSSIQALGGLLSNGPLAALVALAVAGAVAMTSFGAAASLLATALSGLIGIVTALASALVIGIAGALLVIGPLLLAAATGVGALFVAFKDGADTAKAAVKPITDFFQALAKPVEDALFKNLATDMGNLKTTLNNFIGPALIGAADALSDAFTHLSDALNDPAVQAVLTTLGTTLPPILDNMGKALGDFLVGALAFFTPIAYWAGLFAQYIADAAASFEDWATSTEGQSSITTFIAQAATLAAQLWGLVVSIGKALFDTFTQAEGVGGGFLQNLTDIVTKFDEWVNSQAGRDQIAAWLAFAEQLGAELAQTVGVISQALLDLDTPQNRQALLDVVAGLNAILFAAGKVASAGATLFDYAIASIKTFIGWIESLIDWVKGIPDAVETATGKIGAFFAAPGAAIDKVTDAVRNLISWLGKVKIPDAVSKALGGIGKALNLTASGGVFSGAQTRTIGEAGPEAVVPLSRPLSLVDPSVRWLSALAQGKGGGNQMAAGGVVGGGLNIAPGAIVVQTPVSDPAIVASMVFDRLVAQAK